VGRGGDFKFLSQISFSLVVYAGVPDGKNVFSDHRMCSLVVYTGVPGGCRATACLVTLPLCSCLLVPVLPTAPDSS
jgi:hypothetical protein